MRWPWTRTESDPRDPRDPRAPPRDREHRHETSPRTDDEPDLVHYAELYDHWGARPDVEFSELVRRRESDVRFQLAVIMGVAYSVGDGYHITADQKNIRGRKGLEICTDFANEWNLDEINQLVALDAWAAGNAFLTPLREGQDVLSGIKMLPLSSFVRIARDAAGDVTHFVQEWGHSYKEIDPAGVYHFAWLPRNASAFGAGLGQAMARKGVGYLASNGKRIRRPSMFEISEMTDDVATKMTYAGVPRFMLNVPSAKPEDVASLSGTLDRMNPLEHVIMNYKDANIDTISLDTQSKFDTFMTKIDNQLLAGNMTPIPRMWSSLNFTYASAEAAIEAYMPLVRMYQRAHARFVENMIFTPLLMQEKGGSPEAVRRADVRIRWGQEKKPTIEEVKQIYEIVKDPMFAERYDPQDLLSMLQEAGVKLKIIKPVVEEVTEQVAELNKARERVRGSVRELRSPERRARDLERDLRLKLLQRLAGGR